MKLIKRILSFPLILIIKMYQYVISPITPMSCRHTPICSSYAIEALRVWGPLKGSWLAVKRLASCHPWGSWGYDPVPEREKMQ